MLTSFLKRLLGVGVVLDALLHAQGAEVEVEGAVEVLQSSNYLTKCLGVLI